MVEKDLPPTQAKVIALGMFKLDLEPLALKVLKNGDAHINYIKHSREHADTLREIVENARALRPLDSNLNYACQYVQRIQEVLVYVQDTCICLTKASEKLVTVTLMDKTRKVRFAEPCATSKDKTHKQVNPQEKQTTNNSVSPSTGVSSSTKASGSKPKSNTKKDRITQTSSSTKKKNKVEDPPRIAKSSLNNKNRVSKIVCNANIKHSVLNANFEPICVTCNECMFDDIHDLYVSDYLNDVNTRVKSKSMKFKSATRQTFTIDGNLFLLTRITSTKVVPLKETTSKSVTIQNPEVKVIQIVLWYLDSGCSKHMAGNHSQLINFVHKFLGTVRFRNNQIAKIMGYGDYQLRNVTISRVYYVEDGDALLSGSRDTNLYTISLDDMLKSSPICLVRGLPKLKFKKDHLCSACSLGKSKKSSHKSKADDTNQEKLYLLYMDLCGPMCVESINGKKYILVIVDDYSRFTWVMFLRSKDEAPETPYELMHEKKPDLSFLHVFGLLCYPTNDSEDLGKLKPKADIGIFVGYAPTKKAFRIYNKRTQKIMETIHVTFDKLTTMASE
ncbi:retrovirus-related pol polyprotein from transposon TNT 1-94 [Tanacetum coccineum]